MNDEFEYRFDLLKQEIDNLQSGIRAYDGILLVIKGWAVTGFSALVVFAVDKHRNSYLIICATVVVMFWLLDSIYKTIQLRYTRRFREIENFLQSERFSSSIKDRSFSGLAVPATSASFHTSGFKSYSRAALGVVRTSFMLHNAFLYLTMFVLIGVIAGMRVLATTGR